MGFFISTETKRPAATRAFLFMNETKTQRVERLKREKNPWEALDELRAYARRGFDAIPPEWIGTYLRWWGVYTQGDGAGVIGGQGGEGKSTPYFMTRIRVTNGLLRAQQVRAIAEAADAYAHAEAEFALWDMLLRDKNIAEATEVARRIAKAYPDNTEVAVFLATRATR